jgi:hypothetical protein
MRPEKGSFFPKEIVDSVNEGRERQNISLKE